MQSSEPDVCIRVRLRKSAEAARTSGRLAFAVISTKPSTRRRLIHFLAIRVLTGSRMPRIDPRSNTLALQSLLSGVQSRARRTGRAIAAEAAKRGTGRQDLQNQALKTTLSSGSSA